MNPITPAACSSLARPLKKSNIFLIFLSSFSPKTVIAILIIVSLEPIYWKVGSSCICNCSLARLLPMLKLTELTITEFGSKSIFIIGTSHSLMVKADIFVPSVLFTFSASFMAPIFRRLLILSSWKTLSYKVAINASTNFFSSIALVLVQSLEDLSILIFFFLKIDSVLPSIL